MGRPKKEVQEEQPETFKMSFVDRVCSEVEKEYGENLISSAEEITKCQKIIIPSCPTIDILTSGGFEEGSWVGITGAEKLGKTTLALTIAANAQKLGKTVYFGAVECRLEKKSLEGIKGLDINPDKFRYIGQREGQVLTSKDHLSAYLTILKNHPGCVLIIDNISSLLSQSVQDKGVGTQDRGAGNKPISQFLDLAAPIVAANKSLVIGITRLISNTSGWGMSLLEKTSNAWKYQRDYVLWAKKRKIIFAGQSKKPVGQSVTWTCLNSKLGPPGMVGRAFLRFGVGFDKLNDLIAYGVAAKIIQKGGAWYEFEGEKFQGEEKLYWGLSEKQDLVDKLEKQIYAYTDLYELLDSGEEKEE